LKAFDKIVVIGAVGTAMNILYQIKDAILNYNYPGVLEGFIIDDPDTGNSILDFKVIGTSKMIKKILADTDFKFIYSLYHKDKMEERYSLFESYSIPQERLANFVHPLSYASLDLQLGTGNIILSNSTIQSGVKIGNNNIINSNVTIEHNTSIGNGNFFSANSCVGSNVKISNHCFVGLNSSIRENTKLDNNVFIGMHSLVISNYNNVAVAGVPARPIIRKNK
jgi:sugar O-acyltransferase (sialic acid O-acetyltransferase NeuD family)